MCVEASANFRHHWRKENKYFASFRQSKQRIIIVYLQQSISFCLAITNKLSSFSNRTNNDVKWDLLIVESDHDELIAGNDMPMQRWVFLMQLSHPKDHQNKKLHSLKQLSLIAYLLIMIHQLEGILLIRIKSYYISNSYETKSKTFVIKNDFCWIEASVNSKTNQSLFSVSWYQWRALSNLHAKLAWWIARRPHVSWMITFQISFSCRIGPFAVDQVSRMKQPFQLFTNEFLTSSLQCAFVTERSCITWERWARISIAVCNWCEVFR